MPSQQAQSRIQLHAAIMRSHLTPSEARLWSAINRRQLGAQFRRQVVVGGKFVADFLAAEAHLIVEVDGTCHQRRRSADARRDAKLARLGYRVLRLPAALVMEQLPVAVGRVREALQQRP
jgi:very-short-patch-repair endonuclease